MVNRTNLVEFRNNCIETYEKTKDGHLLAIIAKTQNMLVTYGDMPTFFVFLDPDSVHQRFLKVTKQSKVKAQLKMFEINGDMACLILSEYI